MTMSDLDDAIKQHMTHIVFEEHRPFSYLDFLHFEVGATEYKMTHGTFRNKVSRLVRDGVVELSYNSGLAFYTLKGAKFGRPMTANHTGVISNSHPVAKIIRNLPFDKTALHDIHIRLQVKGCWSVFSGSPAYNPDPVSMDIRLPLVRIDELRLRVTIHKTDIITVVAGCSCAPIAVEVRGIIRLSIALARVEERLSRLLEDCSKGLAAGPHLGRTQALAVIPDHRQWIVTMWHFGADASIEYTGEKFSASWEIGQNELLRVYSKEFHWSAEERENRAYGRNKTEIRVEMQEYPQTTVENAIKNIVNRGRFANY
jgi:hypothetical protein